MSLKLSKTNIEPYNYYSVDSIGEGSNAITTELTLDYGAPIKYSEIIIVYLIATLNIYTNISVTILYENPGTNWFLSYDTTNWYKTIMLSDVDSRDINKIRNLYFRSAMLNDGTVIDGKYFQCKILVTANEIIK